jgi:hypothetical protein
MSIGKPESGTGPGVHVFEETEQVRFPGTICADHKGERCKGLAIFANDL